MRSFVRYIAAIMRARLCIQPCSGRILSQPLIFDDDRVSYPSCWLVGPQRLRWALLCGPTSKPQNVLDLTPIAHPHTSPGMDVPSRHAERRRVHECRNHAKLEERETTVERSRGWTTYQSPEPTSQYQNPDQLAPSFSLKVQA
jgi:hypothetical protein